MSTTPAPTKNSPSNYSFDNSTMVEFKSGHHQSTFKCRIEGVPRPQTRSFATTKANNKKVRLWDTSKPNKKSFASAFKAAMSKANASFDTTTSKPIFVSIKFFFPHPKKHFILNHVTKTFHLSASAPTHVTKAPDIDNCEKLVLDALQGIICANDSNVVQVHSVKLFDHSHTIWDDSKANKGCTLIKVTQIDESTFDPACTCHSCSHKKKLKK